MSNAPQRKAACSNPDAAPSGRPLSAACPKPVTEERARAQRQRIDREREKRLESPGAKEHPTVSRPLPLKTGSQAMTVKRALEGYIQDQIGDNRSKKTIEWYQTALGLFSTYLAEQEQMTLVTEINAIHITGWFAHLRTAVGGHGKIASVRTENMMWCEGCLWSILLRNNDLMRSDP